MARERQNKKPFVAGSAAVLPDSHWPMDIGLIALGAILTGVANHYQRFDDPRWTHNTWTSLVVITVALVVALVTSRWVSRRWVRHSMQFAVMVSLLAHLTFLVATWRISVPAKPWTRTMPLEEIVQQRPRRTAPDYVRHQLADRQAQPDFAKPVETASPSPRMEPMQRPDLPEQPPQEVQLESTPDPEPTARPNPIARREPGESTPRQSEEAGRLSRTTRLPDVPLPTATPLPDPVLPERSAPAPPLSAPVVARTKERAAAGSLPEPQEVTSTAPQPAISRAPAQRAVNAAASRFEPVSPDPPGSPTGRRPVRVARSITAENSPAMELPEVERAAVVRGPELAPVPAPSERARGPTRSVETMGGPSARPAPSAPDRLSPPENSVPRPPLAPLSTRSRPSIPEVELPRAIAESDARTITGIRRSRAAARVSSSSESVMIPETLANDQPAGSARNPAELSGLNAGSDENLRDLQAASEGTLRAPGRIAEGTPSVVAPRAITGPVYDEQLAALEASSDRRRSEGRRNRPYSQRVVEVEAAAGAGGLGSDDSRNAGIDDRRARTDSPEIQTQVARFPRRQVGLQPPRNPTPVVAAEAFRQRLERSAAEAGGQQLSPETERAIELGLVYLARNQQEDGRWVFLGRGEERPSMQSDSAATALSLLAFQGAGYTHQRERYAAVVRGGLEFLLRTQQSDGSLFVEADDESNLYGRLYSHGIAALALCEAYGMTQDSELKAPAQHAVDFIVNSQHRELGGWRYVPNNGSDTSVTGWMMMALKSGELAGLSVPRSAYRGVESWLDQSQASAGEPHLYRYNPLAPDTVEQRHGRRPTATMTAVGLLLRLYVGWNREDSRMQLGADYLRANAPALGSLTETNAAKRRDTYYWYYATQVMFHMGGEHWKAWHERLHPLLVESQEQEGEMAGSWDPLRPVPDRWAGHAGRLYVTTLNLLSLEVAYRHLPLYMNTGQ